MAARSSREAVQTPANGQNGRPGCPVATKFYSWLTFLYGYLSRLVVEYP